MTVAAPAGGIHAVGTVSTRAPDGSAAAGRAARAAMAAETIAAVAVIAIGRRIYFRLSTAVRSAYEVNVTWPKIWASSRLKLPMSGTRTPDSRCRKYAT